MIQSMQSGLDQNSQVLLGGRLNKFLTIWTYAFTDSIDCLPYVANQLLTKPIECGLLNFS